MSADSALWQKLNDIQNSLTRLETMMAEHVKNENIHHNMPCPYLNGTNKNILAVVGAVVVALLSGLGALVMELMKR